MLAIASARYSKGQMTMEFMAMFPIMVIIACIAVNAVLFFSECAGFDVQAKNAIRTYAASPGYGETGAAAGPRIQSALEAEFSSDTTSVSVTSSNQDGGMVRFDATRICSGWGFAVPSWACRCRICNIRHPWW